MITQTETDEGGAYTCEGIPFGLYVIEASYGGKSAYTTMELSIQEDAADTIVLDADIVDLNGDNVDELLVYCFAKGSETYSEKYTTLYVDAYTVVDNEITRIATRELFADGQIDSRTWCEVGLMEVKGKVCLYVEYYSLWKYFADGESMEYNWYGMDENGDFRKLWQVGHEPGSDGFRYLMFDYTGNAETATQTIIYDTLEPSSSEALITTPDMDEMEVLQRGFQLLGLDEASVAEVPGGMSSQGYGTTRVSYWPTCSQSCEYTCKGEEIGNFTLRQTVTVSDKTALKEHIEAVQD